MKNDLFQELYHGDLHRYSGGISRYLKKFHYLLRRAQTSKGLVKYIYHVMLKLCREKHGLEISDEVEIGKGLYLGHPYNITINTKAVIGNNCNLAKGVTIGMENRGARKGAPIIGNDVWIGVNATVVGSISVGEDVLIAPNSFVNCDIPSHSVVYGNPCVIKHKDKATEDYINDRI